MEVLLTYPPTAVYQRPYKQVQVLPGNDPGTKRYIETIYNVTIYDRAGVLQRITNSYTVNYVV